MATRNDIHPGAYIGDGVSIGEGARIGPGAVLLGPLTIGDRVWIGPNAVLGAPPEISSIEQNTAWNGHLEHMGVTIGDDVVIRELSTVHQGSHRPTQIGAGSWLLNSSYVAHDCQIGESVTVSAGVRIGGHSVIGDHANIGMNASIHQRRVVGPGAMVGMGTPVTKDIPPFAKAFGSPVRARGVNIRALRTLRVAPELIEQVVAAYAAGDVSLAAFDDDILGPIGAQWRAADVGAVVERIP